VLTKSGYPPRILAEQVTLLMPSLSSHPLLALTVFYSHYKQQTPKHALHFVSKCMPHWVLLLLLLLLLLLFPGLAVAVFRALPEQRSVLLAELLSSTGLLGMSAAGVGGGGAAAAARAPPREFLAQVRFLYMVAFCMENLVWASRWQQKGMP